MIFAILIPLWFLAVFVAVRDIDREQTARMQAAKKIRPLTSDEEAVRGIYIKRDEDRRKGWAATRYADQQAWGIRYQEAMHIKHIRDLRLLWDGVVRIGEDVA